MQGKEGRGRGQECLYRVSQVMDTPQLRSRAFWTLRAHLRPPRCLMPSVPRYPCADSASTPPGDSLRVVSVGLLATSLSGTSSPRPTCISSGAWPAKAACGRTSLPYDLLVDTVIVDLTGVDVCRAATRRKRFRGEKLCNYGNGATAPQFSRTLGEVAGRRSWAPPAEVGLARRLAFEGGAGEDLVFG